MIPSPSRRKWWAYGVLVAEVLAFYRLVVFVPGYVIPWDLRYYHFPIAAFFARSLANGELPLWAPYAYCGMPIYANMQAQLFYPPALIAIFASNWLAPERLLYFLELQLIAHVLLAGIFTYWLLRRLRLSALAAATGATVYQLGAFFASQTQHLGAIDAAAWLPLALWATAALREEIRAVYVAALAIAFGMSILAGFPAVTVVVFAGCFLLALLYVVFRETSPKLVLYVVAASIWSALLAAIQLLPTLELTRWSVAKYRSDFLAGHGGLPVESLASLVLPNHYSVFDLSHFSLPFNPTFLYTYCGVAGLALAVIGAARRSRHSWIFLIVTLAGGIWMLGEFTPAGKPALAALPRAMQSAIYPEYALALFTMGMAVLAGLGAARFESRGVGWALLAVTAIDLVAVSSARPMNTGAVREDPGISREQFQGSRELVARVRALVNEAVPPWRIDTVDDSLNWASGAALFEIPDANGNDPFALERYIQVRLSLVTNGARWGRYYQVSVPDSPVLSLLNVRYLLSHGPVSSANLVKAGEVPGSLVYENPHALPRFFLVDKVERVANMEEGLRILRSSRFRPGELATVEGQPLLEQRGTDIPACAVSPDEIRSGMNACASVTVLRYAPRQIDLETDTPRAAYLVTSEAYYPGWRAYVDNREQPLFLTDVAFRGLPVPAGRHRIHMRFDPPVLRRGAAITGVAWIGVIWVAASAIIIRRAPWTS